ncbi:MAG: TIGR03087 family PEP-CTERM/XrtA system glycosyltransferase [Gammaproteobacteria bacterium]|nr:TIGR03087 family PEP-CTERM/XrtA system glycosyltransferase [Gammaproteobacteria bacterium]
MISDSGDFGFRISDCGCAHPQPAREIHPNPKSEIRNPKSPGLLFLAHRVPYPPDKGDKIRAWHLLEHLSRRYRVHLAAFVDDPEDWRHCDKVRSVCASTYFAGLNPHLGKLRALTGLLTGDPLTLPYYRHAGMQAWVDAHLRGGVDRVLTYSSAMARFVVQAEQTHRVMDFVDIDSDKWRQYATTKSWPLSWLYRREGKRLLRWERKVAATFDASLFVSATEAADFRALAPESAARIGYYNNGVDADYYSPERAYDNPYPAGVEAVAFTGAMDYWPNMDAVDWYAREVLPHLRASRPNLLFAIVGSRPPAQVQALATLPGVLVTGRVDDVRPWLAHARVVVAPLRIARGIQNKVLEGMAMARTVVATPQALEGINAWVGEEVRCAASAADLARETLAALEGPELGPAARARVLNDFAWDSALARVDRLLET